MMVTISRLALVMALAVLNGCDQADEQAQIQECDRQDFVTQVSAAGHCLALNVYRSPALADKPTLIAYVHGDNLENSGDRAVAGFRKIFPQLPQRNVIFAAITRPGYANDKMRSNGQTYYHEGDAYRSHTVSAVSQAILNLKDHYGAKRLVVIGHSGGASILANAMGAEQRFRPNVAILLAGNFNLKKWAEHRSFPNWYRGRGLSPHAQITGISPNVKIIAMTGENDTNTLPDFAAAYVKDLTAAGKQASFTPVKNTDHDNILKNLNMWQALAKDIF